MSNPVAKSTAVLALAWSLAGAVARAQETGDKVLAPERLENILTSMKLEWERKGTKDANGQYEVKIGKLKAGLVIHPRSLHGSAGFGAGQYALEPLNDWNRLKPFSRAYLENNGVAWLVADLPLIGGMPEQLIVDWLRHFQATATEFNAFLHPAPVDDQAAKEMQNFQGIWLIIGFRSGGNNIPVEVWAREESTVTVVGNRFTIRQKNQVRAEANLTVFPQQKPRGLDIFALSGPSKGLLDRAIYTLDQDRWTICTHDKTKAQKERPAAMPGPEDTNFEVMQLRRATQEEVDSAAVKHAALAPQEAGWGRHDYKAYMACWTEDARMISARREAPSKYDVEMSLTQIKATRRLLMHGPRPANRKITWENPQVKLQGNEAEVRVRATMAHGQDFETVDEVYRLRKTPTGWKVFLNRGWPVRSQVGALKIEVDPDLWKKLDAEADDALQKDARGDQAAKALTAALRLREAYGLLKKITARPDANAADWLQRGQAALAVGDAEDALVSFRRALQLDAAAPVPEFARPKRD